MKYIVVADHGDYKKGQILASAPKELIDSNHVVPIADDAQIVAEDVESE